MVPGRRDRRSTSVAVRRTCGAESELEEGKIGRGRRVQTQNTIHYQHTNSSPDEYEFDSQIRSSTGEMLDARTSACSGLTLDRSCSACSTATKKLPRHLLGSLEPKPSSLRSARPSSRWPAFFLGPLHEGRADRNDEGLGSRLPTGLSEGFFVGSRTVLLSTSWSGVTSSDSTTKLTSDKNTFGEGRRRSPQACVRQGRCQKRPTLTLLAEVWELLQPGALFLWKQCSLNDCSKS